MNILVAGAGAVGGYFGGRLADAGEQVTFFCRGETLRAMESQGLSIESVDGDARVRPRCVEKAADAPATDLILWAVKTYHNPEAIDAIRPAIGDGTLILSLQNGVDAVDDLSGAFGTMRVIGGFASIAAESVRPGVIRHTALGRITLGEIAGGESDRTKAIASMFARANIPCRLSTDIRRDLWGKLVWNAAFNPLSVILRATVESILADPSAVSILRSAMVETVNLAKAEGHELSPKLLDAYLDPAAQSGEFRTSMLQDFLRGRPMEIDSISGSLVRRARSRNIAAPVNSLLFDLVKFLSGMRGRRRWTSRTG